MSEFADINQLKQIELLLLKAFISSCEQLGLRYYVLGGTCLGAVRHRGFIPWDDDIDVGMPREDYEIWIRKAQTVIDDKTIFVQSLLSEPELPLNYAKLRKSDTTFIETSAHNCKINHGVFIDIFPLDYYPEKKIKQRIFKFRKRVYTSIISQVFDVDALKINYSNQHLKNNTNKSNIQVTRILKKFICRLFASSPQEALIKRDKLYKSIKKSGLICNLSGAWGEKEIVPSKIFSEAVQLPFEGLQINAPKYYQDYLTYVYGDYMKLPPVEQRISHHYTDVIDLEKSYVEYIK